MRSFQPSWSHNCAEEFINVLGQIGARWWLALDASYDLSTLTCKDYSSVSSFMLNIYSSLRVFALFNGRQKRPSKTQVSGTPDLLTFTLLPLHGSYLSRNSLDCGLGSDFMQGQVGLLGSTCCFMGRPPWHLSAPEVQSVLVCRPSTVDNLPVFARSGNRIYLGASYRPW